MMDTDDIDDDGKRKNVQPDELESLAAGEVDPAGGESAPRAARSPRKRGRKLGQKNRPRAEGAEPKARAPRKTAEQITDHRAAAKACWGDLKIHRQAILAESPGSDVAWMVDRIEFDAPPPDAPTCVELPPDVVEQILGSSMSLLATGLGVGPEFSEVEAGGDYRAKLKTCAEAWSNVSKYYPVVSPGPLAIMAAVSSTVALGAPVGKLYLDKRKAGRAADPAMMAAQDR